MSIQKCQVLNPPTLVQGGWNRTADQQHVQYVDPQNPNYNIRICTLEYVPLTHVNKVVINVIANKEVDVSMLVLTNDNFIIASLGWEANNSTWELGDSYDKLGIMVRYHDETAITPSSITSISVCTWNTIPYRKYGTETDTITTLPKTIIGDGQDISAYTIKGNMQQSGTPTPQNPIYPQETGDKTANLWNEDYTGISSSATYKPIYVGDGEFTLSTTTPKLQGTAVLFLLAGNVASGISTDSNGVWYGQNRTVTAVNGYITLAYRAYTNLNPVDYQSMLNTGSTALPYEPYGYKIPILSGGTTTNVYLGEVQSTRNIAKYEFTGQETNIDYNSLYTRFEVYLSNAKSNGVRLTPAFCSHYQIISDGRAIGDVPYESLYSDVENSTRWFIKTADYTTVADFKTYLAQQYANGTPVTIWYILATPTTGTLNEPLRKIGDYSDSVSVSNLPTTGTAEQFDVDTTLKPSEVSLTYHGWHEHSDTKY